MTHYDVKALCNQAKIMFAFYPEYTISIETYYSKIITNSMDIIEWFQSKGLQGKVINLGTTIEFHYKTN